MCQLFAALHIVQGEKVIVSFASGGRAVAFHESQAVLPNDRSHLANLTGLWFIHLQPRLTLWRCGKNRLKCFHRPVSQAQHSLRHFLLELDVGLHITFRGIAHLAFASPKDLAAHERAIFEVHMQKFSLDGAEDNACAGLALRLGKIETDQAAIGEPDSGVAGIPGVSRLQRVVGTDQSAILEYNVRRPG